MDLLLQCSATSKRKQPDLSDLRVRQPEIRSPPNPETLNKSTTTTARKGLIGFGSTKNVLLALSLQPANGSDILLQTREWFPPARALPALSAFRLTRLSLSKPGGSGSASSQPEPDISDSSFIGDDPLAASSGQVTVGVESKYRIVYRLVNTIYVLGITTVDSPNVFDTINTVNQAVSVVVAACRGVDVTPEKLHRKYPEIYMALDIVLCGVGSVAAFGWQPSSPPSTATPSPRWSTPPSTPRTRSAGPTTVPAPPRRKPLRGGPRLNPSPAPRSSCRSKP